MDTVRIGIIDDNDIVRNVLRVLLTTYSDTEFDIVLELSSLVDVHSHEHSNPDAILLDINMPHIDGITGIPILKRLFPDCVIIMLTDREDLTSLRKSISAGALGYVKKGTNQQELVFIIKQVIAGGSYVSPILARSFFTEMQEKERTVSHLTEREQSIVRGIVDGMSYKLIAHHYGISLDTVREHIKKIYRKLNINSKGELLAIVKF
ncbi:DNA-binding response regulator [Sphingobacterium sp. Ka21]|uniref:DNA-binding response regulator n=2 Tax=Sphingobacterium pedocola TaxID=2082722 RepID=A0ABR9T9P7_9SPHI|nr:DNA-binding response regulator [Sphingobacterium pedocola]